MTGQTVERAQWQAVALFFLLTFFLLSFFFLRMSILWDSDSYYHLAVARHDAIHGVSTPVPWARFSLLSNGGDKELLFHLALIPFASAIDPSTGGRLAAAFFNALIATLLAWLTVRAIGVWGFAVPLWLWIAAPVLVARLVRLRPELLALTIILAAIPFAARRNRMALALLAALFAWSYTAWHVFLFLCVLWLMESGGIAACTAGTLAGLLLRPHPLANLRIWYVQNVLFFLQKSGLDVGNEIGPPSSGTLVQMLPWLGAIAAIVYYRRPCPDRRLAWAVSVPALVFALLFLGMARMSVYAIPLLTMAALFWCVPRKLPLILGVSALCASPFVLNPQLLRILRGGVSEADWNAFGRAVPSGARIAASWGDAEIYAFAAPQGRYLNVLDPIFMAVPHRREYDAQRSLFDGSDPDPATTAHDVLDSDYLAFDWTGAPRSLIERVKSDPRFRVRYGGYNVLLQIVPVPNLSYVDLSPAPRGKWSGTLAGGSYLFSPYGASSLAIDGRIVLRSSGTAAVVGRGARFEVPAGRHRIEVDSWARGRFNGFYLLPATSGQQR